MPRIGHRQPGEGAGRRLGVPAHVGVVEHHRRGVDRERASLGHGVPGVDDQVHDDLFDLAGVGADACGIVRQPRDEVDVLADDAAQHPFDPADDLVEIEQRRLHDVLATEDQQLPRQRHGAAGGAPDLPDVLPNRAAGRQLGIDQF